jgi:hypothetical protein
MRHVYELLHAHSISFSPHIYAIMRREAPDGTLPKYPTREITSSKTEQRLTRVGLKAVLFILCLIVLYKYFFYSCLNENKN